MNESSEIFKTVPSKSASVETSTQSELPPSPKIECESDLKFIWLKPNMQAHYQDCERLIRPMYCTPCEAKELKSQITADWKDSRIFLCVSATQARDLLPYIHQELALYLIYILCENKAEEEKIQRENNKFNKVRIATSDGKEFLRRLAVDIVPSLIEVGDMHLKESDRKNARRWYESARRKTNESDDSQKNSLLLTINEKIKQC